MPKVFFTIILITLFALLYVWHQTEILRLAYEGQRNLGVFQELLDKNHALRYNIKKSASLVQISSKVSRMADFQMPDNYRLVRVAQLPENRQALKRESLVSRFFSIKRHAEAKTLER